MAPIGIENPEAKLTESEFFELSGRMAGYPFVKTVLDKEKNIIHFLDDKKHKYHALYIGEEILGLQRETVTRNIDEYNQGFYFDPDRRFYLGIIAFHKTSNREFFTLETVEVDTMSEKMLCEFYSIVKKNLEFEKPLLLKPANHFQENAVRSISQNELPRIFNYEIFEATEFVPLNEGQAKGRIRIFDSIEEFNLKQHTIEWYDIIVMNKVPEDIPRVSGIINSQATTPLSHTNVLACGWKIPNSIQIGALRKLKNDEMDGKWVSYRVNMGGSHAELESVEAPTDLPLPEWKTKTVNIEEPDLAKTEIINLDKLRMIDRFQYGTKAANLGELRHLLHKKSDRILGFYSIPRPPRQNLLNFAARFLGLPEYTPADTLHESAWEFLKKYLEIPRGIALPFSFQQEFLTTSPQIQQQIGKLKMALELNLKEIDGLCLMLQNMIRKTRMSVRMRDMIDSAIVKNLAGVSSFVVRSSSNAEDLESFSAAGIYESINHVTTSELLFDSIKEVWASLVSPRSVRLRHEAGISLDDCYMGVILQEEVPSDFGGVMVTTNPSNPADFRNIFMNVSTKSAVSVVQGSELPIQYLYNTVEGNGRTISLGNAKEDLGDDQKHQLEKLSFIGRLLQSHFSKDYTFSAPQDIEWCVQENHIYILQLRPYAAF